MKTCPPGKGFILDENENCVCPPGYAFDENGNCIPCPADRGFIVDSNGRCVCDSSRGLVLDPTTKRCVCPPGKELDANGFCVDSMCFFPPAVVSHSDQMSRSFVKIWPILTIKIATKVGSKCCQTLTNSKNIAK